MSDRPPSSGDAAGEPDPTVTFALRAMSPPEHGDGFWDRLEASLRAEPSAPTVAVPLVVPPPPPPPLAEVVPLPASRERRPPARWIAAAAVLLVAVAAAVLVRSPDTDVKTTPAAPDTTIEAPSTTSEPLTTLSPLTTTGPAVAPPTTLSPGFPTSTGPHRTSSTSPPTTAKPVSLILSPDGLGPLRLGMTTTEARATGAAGPYAEQNPGCGTARPAGPYQDGDFGLLFQDLRLTGIYAGPTSRLRTPQGIGVGSPASSLSSVPGTRVDRPNKYQENLTDVEITTGDVGYLFTVDEGTSTVTVWSVGTRAVLDLAEGCS